MSVGFGQIIVIIIIVIFLFGKFPGLSKDFLSGITNIQNLLKQKHSNENTNSEDLKLLDSKKKTDNISDSTKK